MFLNESERRYLSSSSNEFGYLSIKTGRENNGKIFEAVMQVGLGDLGGGALEGLSGGRLGLPSPSTTTAPSVGVPF